MVRFDLAEQPANLAHAMMDGARERGVQQHKARHPRRRRAGGMQSAIGVIAGCRAQQRIPLADIDRRADIGWARQQQMVFDVEKARRLVGPLDVPADLVEVPALVAEECPFGDAGMGLAGFLDHRKQRRQIAGCKIFGPQFRQAIVEHVKLNPHLGGNQRPQCASVLARVADCADDRGRIVAVDDIKIDDVVRGGRVVAGEKTFLIRIQLNDRPPVLTAAAVAREGLVDIENPREVLGALDIAR